MAIAVEDGSIVENAVSYCSTTYAKAYASARGLSSRLPGSDAKLESLLVLATDYIETFASQFQGSIVDQSQSLQWPRQGAYINGYPVGNDEIPIALQKAVAQLALDADKGEQDLMPNGEGREVIRMKVEGAIEFEYAEQGMNGVQPKFAKAISLLSPLFRNHGSAGQLTVRRT